MRNSKVMILLVLLFMFSLTLTSCADAGSNKPGEVETVPENEIGLDGDWMLDGTPPYAYAQAMRDRLDPYIEEAFGIAEVHYNVYESLRVNKAGEGTYDVRYVLVDAPPHDEAFYYTLDDVLNKAFDFYIFGEYDDAEGYFKAYDELPEHVAASITFEDENYYWEVFYDGTYLGFSAF